MGSITHLVRVWRADDRPPTMARARSSQAGEAARLEPELSAAEVWASQRGKRASLGTGRGTKGRAVRLIGQGRGVVGRS